MLEFIVEDGKRSIKFQRRFNELNVNYSGDLEIELGLIEESVSYNNPFKKYFLDGIVFRSATLDLLHRKISSGDNDVYVLLFKNEIYSEAEFKDEALQIKEDFTDLKTGNAVFIGIK